MIKAHPYTGPVPKFLMSAVESDTDKFVLAIGGDNWGEVAAMRDRVVRLLNLYEGVPTDEIREVIE